MTKHTCKNCNRIFEYCRGCLLSPIPHMDAGFCSKECYEASKNVVVEPEVIDEVVVVEELEQTVEIIEDVQPIDEKVEAEAVATAETTIEATTVVEPTIKNETNTYKKKKNKYKVHE